ncbi:hypothetical protein BDN70DRAFT_983659 [Pholiota conissans]|uniref:Uncharacterized protein n=1 Tax=Pholiota conissans TaxID=109636 RepID=A0A9P6CLD3_9AGAR|nr:hypothetical protein BDN70DRAFT_983659 [Pholiota conissans]
MSDSISTKTKVRIKRRSSALPRRSNGTQERNTDEDMRHLLNPDAQARLLSNQAPTTSNSDEHHITQEESSLGVANVHNSTTPIAELEISISCTPPQDDNSSAQRHRTDFNVNMQSDDDVAKPKKKLRQDEHQQRKRRQNARVRILQGDKPGIITGDGYV